jgi:A/G-specific adenine glycosylase
MPPQPSINPALFQNALLEWYKVNARPLPWRQTTNAYPIWLAEIMLQQTTVATVIPYWQKFLSAFPTIHHLASAPLEQVLNLWQGLGYYRRAHLLHTCAKAVSSEHNGVFPATESGLLALPGIGPYTAAAIATTAFNQPAVVLDGNVERVVARLFRLQKELPKGKPAYRAKAAFLASSTHPCTYANAIMELGATVCTPKNPKCGMCPVSNLCAAFKLGDMLTYPRKTPAQKIPHIQAKAYLIYNNNGHIYLRQRPSTGMLASLFEAPCTSPNTNKLGWPNTLKNIPKNLTNRGNITHVFSHFKLTVQVYAGQGILPEPWQAFTPNNLPPLSTLMQKIIALLPASAHRQ